MGKMAKEYGTMISHVLFEVGNNLNLSKIIKPYFNKPDLSISTQEALKKDWDAVGKGVELAFERYEKSIGKQ